MNQDKGIPLDHSSPEERKAARRLRPQYYTVLTDRIYICLRLAISGLLAAETSEEGSPYPQVQLCIYKANDGMLQLGPGPNRESVMLFALDKSAPSLFLSDPESWMTPEDEDTVAKLMWEQWKGRSEIQADIVDVLTAKAL